MKNGYIAPRADISTIDMEDILTTSTRPDPWAKQGKTGVKQASTIFNGGDKY